MLYSDKSRMQAYLGSDSDEEENTDQKETDKKARYKQLLNGASNGTKHGKDWMKENNFDEVILELQVQ